MAEKEATPIKGEFNKITKLNFEAATTASDGIRVKLPSRDGEMCIVVFNSNTTNDYKITVKAPENGGYAAAMTDLSATVTKNGYSVIKIESARYANNNGTILLIPENVAVKVAVIY